MLMMETDDQNQTKNCLKVCGWKTNRRDAAFCKEPTRALTEVQPDHEPEKSWVRGILRIIQADAVCWEIKRGEKENRVTEVGNFFR